MKKIPIILCLTMLLLAGCFTNPFGMTTRQREQSNAEIAIANAEANALIAAANADALARQHAASLENESAKYIASQRTTRWMAMMATMPTMLIILIVGGCAAIILWWGGKSWHTIAETRAALHARQHQHIPEWIQQAMQHFQADQYSQSNDGRIILWRGGRAVGQQRLLT